MRQEAPGLNAWEQKKPRVPSNGLSSQEGEPGMLGKRWPFIWTGPARGQGLYIKICEANDPGSVLPLFWSGSTSNGLALNSPPLQAARQLMTCKYAVPIEAQGLCTERALKVFWKC